MPTAVSSASVVQRFRQRLRTWRALQQTSRDWPRHVPIDTPLSLIGGVSALSKLLLIPSDFRTLVGARGDEAMLRAVSDRLRARWPGIQFAVLTSSAEADSAARELGFQPLRLPDNAFDVLGTLPAINRFKPDAAVLIGADMMDGHYSPVLTARLLLLAEILSHQHVRTVVTGFSFNENPDISLRPFFDRVSKAVQLSVRDPVSHRRIGKFSSAKTQLVADVAFLLRPDLTSSRTVEIRQWIKSEHERGRIVLALNAHPGLVRGRPGEGGQAELVERLQESMAGLSSSHAVSWLLLPHDYRSRGADAQTLAPLAEALTSTAGTPHHYCATPLSAGELKSIAGAVDGVVTGRMHLAIAASGSGVPIACLTYQGKFEGLFEHLQLPPKFLIAPLTALQAGMLRNVLMDFVDSLPELRSTVQKRLPEVIRQSELNLHGLV